VRVADVVIIGGGIAGVACALELARHDVDLVPDDRPRITIE
jgi:glycine/D-amino acid oxidase-like deaminating enzyme